MKQRFVHAALFSAFLFVTDKAQAQYDEAARNYRLWRVESSMGYALPSGPGNKSGLLLSLEPKYNFTDQLSFGLRTEATALARGYVDINGNSFSGKAALGLSFLGTTDYFFTQTLLRPFTGAGIGVYNLVGAEINTGSSQPVQVPAVTRFGGMLRGGVEIWHLRAALEYNLIGKTGEIRNSYLGLKIGIVIGGGPLRYEEE